MEKNMPTVYFRGETWIRLILFIISLPQLTTGWNGVTYLCGGGIGRAATPNTQIIFALLPHHIKHMHVGEWTCKRCHWFTSIGHIRRGFFRCSLPPPRPGSIFIFLRRPISSRTSRANALLGRGWIRFFCIHHSRFDDYHRHHATQYAPASTSATFTYINELTYFRRNVICFADAGARAIEFRSLFFPYFLIRRFTQNKFSTCVACWCAHGTTYYLHIMRVVLPVGCVPGKPVSGKRTE